MNMSMTERIKAGKLFTDMCEGLPEKRLRGKTLMYEFNHSHPSEVEKRGSVVIKDIPPNVVAAGVPCRVIREINDRDKQYYFRDYKVESSV
ncbi:maltose acetyltransferase domain-containing protein [Escherichia coli]|nr:maltose acetyltransferase domain-containing protein [Escherichia coli]